MLVGLFKVFRSFGYAFRGLIDGFSERNMRVHGVGAIIAVAAGWYYHISVTEWLVVVLLIGAIWSAELVNTALEEVCNIMNEHNDLAYHVTRKARDVSAASVVVLAILAVVCAGIIFLPKL
jgi:undecaprenol kinase